MSCGASCPTGGAPVVRTRLNRTASAEEAWNHHIQRDAPQETVAEAFAVIGLPLTSSQQPLMASGSEELVLSNLCLVSASEVKPEGFEVIKETFDRQRAVLSAGGGTVYLAQCLRPQRLCLHPITALRLLDAGDEPPAGFEPVDSTSEAQRALMICRLYVSRAVIDPCDSSPAATPLAGVTVLTRVSGRGFPRMPPGFERLGGVLGAPKAERILGVCRAAPCGLLQTPLKAAMVDCLLRHARPSGREHGNGGGGSESADDADDGYGGEPDDDSFGAGRSRSEAAAHDAATAPLRELPSALPHFCVPQGAQIRVSCPWPTQHDFALTDADGARLYGCCVTVWEPLSDRALVVLRPHSIDERLRLERDLAKGRARNPPPTVRWDSAREEWAAEEGSKEVADEALRSAFGGEQRVVMVEQQPPTTEEEKQRQHVVHQRQIESRIFTFANDVVVLGRVRQGHV